MNSEITPETVERVKTFRELLAKMERSQDQVPVIMTESGALLLIAGIDDDANVIIIPLTKNERILVKADTLLSRKRANPQHIKSEPPVTPS